MIRVSHFCFQSGVSTKFCLIGLLILSGDVKINPGPMMLSGGFSADEGSALLKGGNFPVGPAPNLLELINEGSSVMFVNSGSMQGIYCEEYLEASII